MTEQTPNTAINADALACAANLKARIDEFRSFADRTAQLSPSEAVKKIAAQAVSILDEIRAAKQAAPAPFAPPSETRRAPALRDFANWMYTRQDKATTAVIASSGEFAEDYAEFKLTATVIREIERFTDALEAKEREAYFARRAS